MEKQKYHEPRINIESEDYKERTISRMEIGKHDTFNENLDKVPDNLNQFIPKDYAVINSSTGDLNLDGLLDQILVLRKITEETTSNYGGDGPAKRPMLLLLGQPNQSYKLATRNDNAINCVDCSGAFGDSFQGTVIKKGYFSIENGIAGGQHWQQIITFKYDKKSNNWFLYKDYTISHKMTDSSDENAEALIKDFDLLKTKKDFGTIPFSKFNIYKKDY